MYHSGDAARDDDVIDGVSEEMLIIAVVFREARYKHAFFYIILSFYDFLELALELWEFNVGEKTKRADVYAAHGNITLV